MVVGSDELARLSEEMWADRRIRTDLCCAQCGYNLKTLTYVGRCPECGSCYSARPPFTKGIFTEDMLRFPLEEIFWMVVCLGVTGFCFLGGGPTRMVIGGVFGLLGGCYGCLVWKRMGRYLRLRQVHRRWQGDEDDQFDW